MYSGTLCNYIVSNFSNFKKKSSKNESKLQDFWIKNKCVPTMGLHYFSKDVSDVDPTSGCKDLTPFQLLYIEGTVYILGQ